MFKKPLSTFDKILLYSNLFFSLLLLLSCLTPLINPKSCVLFAFLGLAYPELVVVNFVYGCCWLLKHRFYIFIPATSILIGINNLNSYWNLNYHAQTLQQIDNKPVLKIMTYNVHNFNGLDTPINKPAYNSILQMIKRQNVDVVVLQEFHQENAQYRISDSLKKILNNADCYFEPFVKTTHDSTGLAIFSKLPVVGKGVLRLSNDENDNQVIFADVKSPKGILRIYCVHLQSVKFEAADHLALQKMSLVNITGLSIIIKKLSFAFKARAYQTSMIVNHAKGCKYPYVFAGDFNDIPISYSVRQMSVGMNNSFREKGNGLGETYYETTPGQQIDYILASRPFKVLGYQIIKQKISDHYPVVSTLALN